jgi:hypothetical protein
MATTLRMLTGTSLLNVSIKLTTKVVAMRLQNLLPNLIDEDQTGFVKSRCIADNFVYAVDLVQCCRLRKKKAIILKLGFRKSFDTVSWDSYQNSSSKRFRSKMD